MSDEPKPQQEIVVKLAPETLEEIRLMLEDVVLRPVRVNINTGEGLRLKSPDPINQE